MAKKIRSVFVILAVALIVIAVYVFVHESGHAIVAFFCGAQITRLSILEAHTWWTGGNFTAGTLSLCHAAGALLPICALTLGIFLYKKDFIGPLYHLVYFYFLIVGAASLSVWVLFPILSMFVPLPATDDVAKFLQSSGLPPVAVSLVSLALILRVLVLARRKGMFQKFALMLKSMMSTGTDDGTTLSKKSAWKLTAALLSVILATFLLELPELMDKTIISFSSEDQNAITDFQNSFEVPRSRNYYFDIQLDAGGLLTAIRISDSDQNTLYQNIGEKTSSSGSIYLNEGTYTISVIYLKDMDAFERYCEDIDNGIDETAAGELSSAYKHEFKMPDLSFTIKY